MSNFEPGLEDPEQAAEKTPELIVLKRSERLTFAVTVDLAIRHSDLHFFQIRALMEEDMKGRDQFVDLAEVGERHLVTLGFPNLSSMRHPGHAVP